MNRRLLSVVGVVALMSGAPGAVHGADGQLGGAPPEVVLLHPGSEPRALLRYDLDIGQTERFSLEFEMALRDRTQPTVSPWVVLPTTTVSGTATVVASEDDVTYDVEYRVDDVVVSNNGDPGLAQTLRSQLETFVGAITRTRIDRRGRVLGSETSLAAGSLAAIGMPSTGQLDVMATQQTRPLPAEPVGVGAVWEVSTRTTDASGLESATITTVTLERLGPEGTARITGEVRMRADPQLMRLPGVPAIVEAMLDEMEGRGSYRWDLHPDQLVIGSVGSVTTELAMTVRLGEETETTAMEMRIELRLRPLAEAE